MTRASTRGVPAAGLASVLLAALLCATGPVAVAQDGAGAGAAPGTGQPDKEAKGGEKGATGTDEQGRPLVSNSFFNTDLRQALSDIALDAGVNILPDESISGFITLDLKDMPLEKALRLILTPGGFYYKEIEPNVYVVTPPDPKATSFRLIATSQVLPVSYVDATGLSKMLPDRYAPFVKADPEGRRLLLYGPEEVLAEIKDIVASLDVAPTQVMIEALVLETTAGALREFAPTFSTGRLAGDIAGGIFTYWSNELNVPSTSTSAPTPTPGNVILGLQWLLGNDQAVLRANPRMVAPDGKSAEIEVGKKQYFSLLTGSAVYAYTRLEQVDATIRLTIQPKVVQETGEIICDIEPSVADVVGQGTQGLPVITIRRAKSTVRVKDGQAIVIGGLLQEQDSVSVRRTPVLSELPLIGSLFRSKSRSKVQREIIIIISPHLLNATGEFEGPLLSELLMTRKAVTQCGELPRPGKVDGAQSPPQRKPAQTGGLQKAFGLGGK